jgi:hypothetical protein
MRHVLWLGLLWASSAHAQVLVPAHLDARAAARSLAREAEPTLQLALPTELALALTPPCLGCRAGLRTATGSYAPDPSPPVPAAQAAPRRVNPAQYAIGDSWKLGGQRTLSVRLTPTPEECAPLVRLSF